MIGEAESGKKPAPEEAEHLQPLDRGQGGACAGGENDLPVDPDDEHPSGCKCPDCELSRDPGYQEHLIELALDRDLGRRCPSCGTRSVSEHVTPTRQYGGGYDTFYECSSCGWSEVCV